MKNENSFLNMYIYIICFLGVSMRIYVYAHHMFDVLAGVSIACVFHYLSLFLNDYYNYDIRIIYLSNLMGVVLGLTKVG